MAHNYVSDSGWLTIGATRSRSAWIPSFASPRAIAIPDQLPQPSPSPGLGLADCAGRRPGHLDALTPHQSDSILAGAIGAGMFTATSFILQSVGESKPRWLAPRRGAMLTRNEGVSAIKDGTAGDRCRGVLLGLAAGDLNGSPTRMALRLADSLLDCGGFDSADISRRYVQWRRVDGVDTGPTSGRVLERIADGMIPEIAAETVDRELQGLTAGCNPAHRAPPLAMAGFLPDERLMAFARYEAALTHKHPIAGDVSAAVVVLCRALLRGMPFQQARKVASDGRMWEVVEALLDSDAGPVSKGGYAPEALQAAVHFVEYAPSFAVALAQALDFAGPANYAPVLVGAIAGARWGASGIGPLLLQHAACRAIRVEIDAAAHRLAEGWESTE